MQFDKIFKKLGIFSVIINISGIYSNRRQQKTSECFSNTFEHSSYNLTSEINYGVILLR